MKWSAAASLMLLVALLTGACGGPNLVKPTAVPADAVRPDQPTPVFSNKAPQYQLKASASPVMVTPASIENLEPIPTVDRLANLFLMPQPPTALGIASGGATLVDAPNGRQVVATIPAGSSVTVTGKSGDGRWLAVFADDMSSGWVSAGSLRLFGADDLIVVDRALAPLPVATMLAEAMQPVAVLDEAMATPAPTSSASETSVEASVETLADGAVTGLVVSTSRLNIRSTPASDAPLVGKLEPQSSVNILGRTEAGDWLRVQGASGDGWVAAQFVKIAGSLAALPVLRP